MDISNITNLFEKRNIDLNKPLGLIFDVDELLCQNGREIYLAYKMLLDERGIPIEEGEELPGKNLFDIVNNIRSKYCINTLVDELVSERREHYLRIIKENEVVCSEGVEELFQFFEQLRSEQDVRVAYASSSEYSFVKVLLSKLFHQCELYQYTGNLDKFFYHTDSCYASTCWEEGMKKKPASDVYDVTLEKLNLKSQQCIAFEDSMSGFQSARSAGIFTVLISPEDKKDHFETFEYGVIYDDCIKLPSLLDFYQLLKIFYEQKISKV